MTDDTVYMGAKPICWVNVNKQGDVTHHANKQMPWSRTPVYGPEAIAAAVAEEREQRAKLHQVWEDTRTQRDELLAHIAGRAPLPQWAADFLRAS